MLTNLTFKKKNRACNKKEQKNCTVEHSTKARRATRSFSGEVKGAKKKIKDDGPLYEGSRGEIGEKSGRLER